MKTAVITGASRGIGLATAKKFLSENWEVFGTYNNTVIPITASSLTPIRLDLGSGQSISEATKQILSQTDQIDVLVNCAGIILDQQDTDITVEKIRKTLDIDLLAIINFTEQLLPAIQKGSHIINIDSQYGAFSFPIDDTTSAGYRIAKSALNMYSRILAFHLQGQGVIVSSLDPGWVKTDMGLSAASDTEKPDREVEEPAQDIYLLATTVTESGYFWRFGQKREW